MDVFEESTKFLSSSRNEEAVVVKVELREQRAKQTQAQYGRLAYERTGWQGI